ncbi:MAG: F0F1 ATP synthase subunit B [Marivita sp.]|uniref:F0F1 ATP synthase subunit B n=1 Tax=Marivita sp. TaxID=2003365 RepID=UPI0025C65A5B|nr:F0F1 ATP synthase subunit B [Marivita sp.]MCI5111419.1 F0F1 ATP synthase subunit B [Marivita sp.]
MSDMNRIMTIAAASLLASPAFAASGPFFSLGNTDFVVTIGFLVFIGVLLYFKVPSLVLGMLDKRADGIRAELNEAKALREEAQALLASYERRQREVQEQADRIIAHAKEEAALAGEQAKADLEKSIARRMAAAEDQIASAQASAVKEVRDRAIAVAIKAARDVVAKQMTAKDAAKSIDDAIAEVGQKLH